MDSVKEAPTYATFLELARRVATDTAFLSNPRPAMDHPAMQEIIAMGTPACQFIVDYWAEYPNSSLTLFHALRVITHASPPFPRQLQGRVREAEGAWASFLLGQGLVKNREIHWTAEAKWKIGAFIEEEGEGEKE